MKEIKVIQKTLLNPEMVNEHGWDAAEYEMQTVASGKVAIDSVVEALEFAFMASNNIDIAWVKNPCWSEVRNSEGCRSTSVGDIVAIDGVQYECSPIGWKEVSLA